MHSRKLPKPPLYRSEDTVGAELFEKECRTHGHGFTCRILPGLNAELVRRASLIAKLLPDVIKANQIDRREDQRGFALQISGGSFHFLKHQGQRLVGSYSMIEEKIGDARYQIFHLPSRNADKILIHEHQEEGFFAEGFHCLVFCHGLFAFAETSDQICDLLRIAWLAALQGERSGDSFRNDLCCRT